MNLKLIRLTAFLILFPFFFTQISFVEIGEIGGVTAGARLILNEKTLFL
jgi:hypothetical protein